MITVKDVAFGLKSSDPAKQTQAVQTVRKILSGKVDSTIDFGNKHDVSQWIMIGLTLIPKLTKFLDDTSK